jgi:hypothetical protein
VMLVLIARRNGHSGKGNCHFHHELDGINYSGMQFA